MSMGTMVSGEYKQVSGGVSAGTLARITALENELAELKADVELVQDSVLKATDIDDSKLSYTFNTENTSSGTITYVRYGRLIIYSISFTSKTSENNKRVEILTLNFSVEKGTYGWDAINGSLFTFDNKTLLYGGGANLKAGTNYKFTGALLIKES